MCMIPHVNSHYFVVFGEMLQLIAPRVPELGVREKERERAGNRRKQLILHMVLCALNSSSSSRLVVNTSYVTSGNPCRNNMSCLDRSPAVT